jgi:hypothetical protein
MLELVGIDKRLTKRMDLDFRRSSARSLTSGPLVRAQLHSLTPQKLVCALPLYCGVHHIMVDPTPKRRMLGAGASIATPVNERASCAVKYQT